MMARTTFLRNHRGAIERMEFSRGRPRPTGEVSAYRRGEATPSSILKGASPADRIFRMGHQDARAWPQEPGSPKRDILCSTGFL